MNDSPFSPEVHLRYLQKHGFIKWPPLPKKIIVTAGRGMGDALKADGFKLFSSLGMQLWISRQGTTAVLSHWGMGAPALVFACELSRALGAVEFNFLGFCGSLDANLAVGSCVFLQSSSVAEGTSLMYGKKWGEKVLCQNSYQRPSESVGAEGVSIDALYRETPAFIEQHKAKGITVVDMESSALFSFAQHHSVKASSELVVTDLLSPAAWIPGYHLSEPRKKLEVLLKAKIQEESSL